MLRCLPPSSRSADFARKMYGQGGGPYSGEYKIKHTPIGGATGIYLSCHNTVSGDKRGSDSQYVHVRAALELCNIRSNTLAAHTWVMSCIRFATSDQHPHPAAHTWMRDTRARSATPTIMAKSGRWRA